MPLHHLTRLSDRSQIHSLVPLEESVDVEVYLLFLMTLQGLELRTVNGSALGSALRID